LRERRTGGGSISLLESRAAERAEGDAAERVPVHVIRPLHGVEPFQARRPRGGEVPRAAQALPEVPGDAGRRARGPSPLEGEALAETPARLRQPAELEMRPAEAEPGETVARIDLDGALKVPDGVLGTASVHGAEGREVRGVDVPRIEHGRLLLLGE